MIFKKLPLFTATCIDKDNFGFPLVFDFELFYDPELDMFRQKSNDKLNDLLFDIYKKGSLADGSISSESGKVYVNKVTGYLLANFDFKENSKVLEIGFGLGTILFELNKLTSSKLFGIEPGDYEVKYDLNNIELVNDFFPSTKLIQKFNLIYSLLVLEHVEDPLKFLENIQLNLEKEGTIILAVPNCEQYLLEGDISIFIHEHFSYFTRESIVKLVSKTELEIDDISIIEGALIFTLSNNKKLKMLPLSFKKILYDDFTNRVDQFTSNFLELTKFYEQNDIAIYSPIRAMNFLYLAKMLDVRLVDDNIELKGRFLPSLNSTIESFEQICLKPPKLIVIYSRTFAEKIKLKCKESDVLRETNILCLDQI